jgi:hypothetical protein
MCFGRFQPPTKAHEKMFQKVMDLALTWNGTPFIFCSKTEDSKKNPLPLDIKVQILKKLWPFHCVVPKKDPNEALRWLAEHGYEYVTIVAGDDRLKKYESLGDYINHPDVEKRLHLKGITYISVGKRDEDGVSATKARELAAAGDLNGFKELLPTDWNNPVLIKSLYDEVRKGLNLSGG